MIGTYLYPHKKISGCQRPHLIESVGDALEEGVAGAVVRDALRIRRDVLAHDDGLVSGVGWCIFCFLPALEV